jgi:hypothetical protein
MRNANKIAVRDPEGGPGHRWKYIKMDLKE